MSFINAWWKSLGDLKGNVGLGKHHENLSKNGMNLILSSLYNPYKALPFPVASLWFSKQSFLWNTDLGVFLNYYYLCLLCGSFDGAHLISCKRFCPWLSICLLEAQSPSLLDFYFSWIFPVKCEASNVRRPPAVLRQSCPHQNSLHWAPVVCTWPDALFVHGFTKIPMYLFQLYENIM